MSPEIHPEGTGSDKSEPSSGFIPSERHARNDFHINTIRIV